MLRLDEDARLSISYEDTTTFGSAVTARCDDTVRALCGDITQQWGRAPLADLVRRSDALLGAALAGPLGGLYTAPGVLHPDYLYPRADRVRPAAVVVSREGADDQRVPLDPALVGELARWIGDWQRPGPAPRAGRAAALHARLVEAGAFTDRAPPPRAPREPLTLVGHACVQLTHGDHTLLFDPFLLPAGPEDRDYRPLTPAALGRPDAIFITHSHPDHFDVATLMAFGADVPVWVPEVERESVLTVDMAARLRELGFTRVHTAAWGSATPVGPFTVRALPFYGEQPTSGAVLHPEVRNHGNTYLVDDGARRVALAVDSGRDERGDLARVAGEARARWGRADLVLGGYRAFAKYPLHYLFSSISRYLPFVPPAAWSSRQKIMSDADDLLDAAELWGAPVVVPYADGGAPWLWRHGLGPRLDDPAAAVSNAKIDPPPEHVARTALERSTSAQEGRIASPVTVRILRPGDRARWRGHALEVTRQAPYAWPFDARPAGRPDKGAHLDGLTRGGETLKVVRKKALLRALAMRELARAGADVPREAVQEMTDDFRRQFGLLRAADLRGWLAHEGMTLEEYLAVMREMAAIRLLERQLERDVDARVDGHIKINAVREWRGA